MTQALDYSLARPAPADIVTAGYVGVLRYVAPAMDAPKVITAAEYQALLAAGLKVVLNWEWYANRAQEGAGAGTADAQEALLQAQALGYHGAIYFSVDYDASESDQAAINAYFTACAAVIGLERLGAYGGYWPLSRLFDAGLITYGWQTLAWSGGNRESRAHLYQTGAQVFGGADVNDILKEDWTGGFMVPTGWTDDPTNEVLTAPNGHQVRYGFRKHVLADPFFDPANVPLMPTEATSANVEGKGAGAYQDFVQWSLGYTSADQKIFYLSIGAEFAALKAAPPPPAPVSPPSAADELIAALVKVFPKLA